jgi:hypothetical protein
MNGVQSDGAVLFLSSLPDLIGHPFVIIRPAKPDRRGAEGDLFT